VHERIVRTGRYGEEYGICEYVERRAERQSVSNLLLHYCPASVIRHFFVHSVTQVAFQLRKKLGLGSKYIRSISYTISLIECMVAHGGVRLQAVIGTNFFLMEMARITKKYASKPQEEFQEVSQHLKELIQAWGEIFGGLGEKNKLPFFVKTYYELRQDPNIVFPAQPNLARGPALGSQGHSSEDEAFIADMHNQSQQFSAGPDGRIQSATPPRMDAMVPNSNNMYAAPPFQISPTAQGNGMMNPSPTMQHGFGSNQNINQYYGQQQQQQLQQPGYQQPPPLNFRGPPQQQFTFEQAFDIATYQAQPESMTIDQKTIEENKRILAEIANSRAKQFDSYVYNPSDFDSGRKSSYETTTRPSGGEPYAASKSKPSASEPVLTPAELQSTVRESLIILVDMVMSATEIGELKSNEIAAEFSQKLKTLQPKFSDVIDKALADGAADVEMLFNLNESVMKVTWAYDSVISSSISLIDAKGKIRPIQNDISGNSPRPSNTASYSASYSATNTTKTSTGFVNEYAEYNSSAAAYVPPAQSNSYSSYQPASYSGVGNYGANNNAAYPSYSSANSYVDPYQTTPAPADRRLSGASLSGSSHRLPQVPSGAPEQLYRAESFYRAPASTMIPPVAASSPKTQHNSVSSTMNSYASTNVGGYNNGSYSSFVPPSSGPSLPPQPQQTRGFALPVYKDPFNGATISQPSNSTGSRTSSQTNSRSNSRSGTPERLREFSASNALIEGMLQSDGYDEPPRQRYTKSVTSDYYSDSNYNTGIGAQNGYLRPSRPEVNEDSSPTSVYSSSKAISYASSNNSASTADPMLTRIPATKMNSSAGNYLAQGSMSTATTSSVFKTTTTLSGISTSASPNMSSPGSATSPGSNNPFDSFC
jgi:hypothetical protein